MSYDIDLIDPITSKVLQLDSKHMMRGGTYAVGGTKDASLNITYNYAEHFIKTLGENGIRTIYKMNACDSIPVLENAINMLKDDVHDNYWKPTEGNAKNALIQLMTLAKLRPDGVWTGD